METIHESERGDCAAGDVGSYERGARARLVVTDVAVSEYCRQDDEGSLRGAVVRVGRADVMDDPDLGVKWEQCEGFWWCQDPCSQSVWLTTLVFGRYLSVSCLAGKEPVALLPALP